MVGMKLSILYFEALAHDHQCHWEFGTLGSFQQPPEEGPTFPSFWPGIDRSIYIPRVESFIKEDRT